MKHVAIIYRASILFFVVFASYENSWALQKTNVDTVVQIQSQIIGETYRVHIALPKYYNGSAQKYPVVYVLDATYNFSFSVEAARILYNNNVIPESILVGVESTHRERDFTTAKLKEWNAPLEIPSGGAPKFADFLSNELIPFINKQYRAEPFSVLIGHSLAGVFALYTVSAKPGLFKGYILLDPSVWWNQGEAVNAAINYLGAHPGYKGKLFWGRDKIPREVWFPENTRLYEYLQHSKPKDLEFTYLEMDKETHSTLVFPGTYFGLRDLFADFNYTFSEQTDLKAVKTYYQSLSEKYGYQVKIPERTFDILSGQLTHGQKFDDCLETCKLWLNYYPDSFIANKETGKAYLQLGKKAEAGIYLQAALKLQPGNSEVLDLLKK